MPPIPTATAQRLAEIDRTAKTASFNGKKIFSQDSSVTTANADQQAVIDALRMGWLEQSEDLTSQYYGLKADFSPPELPNGSSTPVYADRVIAPPRPPTSRARRYCSGPAPPWWRRPTHSRATCWSCSAGRFRGARTLFGTAAGRNAATVLQSTHGGEAMQIGMIGLGRMGANMVRRLLRGGHECVVFDRSPQAVAALVKEQAAGSASLAELAGKLRRPRALWLMVPAAAVDASLADLLPHLEAGDIVIDGGNSYYVDDIRRAQELQARSLRYVDVGTSGGVWGLERGYCMMIGGPDDAVKVLDPVFSTLSPGFGDIARTPGREAGRGTAEHGYLHCGPSGAGHFVKMIHNGIEYGLMAAYAEGMSILQNANVGTRPHAVDAETTPLRDAEHYRYDMNLADIAEVWRRGSVISSWLLDLTAAALAADPALARFGGRVADSGEGRWTIKAAIDEAVPAPVLTAALFERFSSRGAAGFQNQLMSAMRLGFGGHVELPESK